MTTPNANATSAHALLSVLAANGIDRVFLVPGESYLGLLDALNDFPQIDVLTCRHEAGAAAPPAASAASQAIAAMIPFTSSSPRTLSSSRLPRSSLVDEWYQTLSSAHELLVRLADRCKQRSLLH